MFYLEYFILILFILIAAVDISEVFCLFNDFIVSTRRSEDNNC